MADNEKSKIKKEIEDRIEKLSQEKEELRQKFRQEQEELTSKFQEKINEEIDSIVEEKLISQESEIKRQWQNTQDAKRVVIKTKELTFYYRFKICIAVFIAGSWISEYIMDWRLYNSKVDWQSVLVHKISMTSHLILFVVVVSLILGMKNHFSVAYTQIHKIMTECKPLIKEIKGFLEVFSKKSNDND